MQATRATFIRRNSSSNVSPTNSSVGDHVGPISVPRPLFGKLIDFLEDKWGTKVIRSKNAFYCAAQQEQPIAWLNSQDTVTIFLIDRASGKRNATQIRIEDILLPTPIRVEYSTYPSLLCHLIRISGGGVVRWFNKFYSTGTGGVLAELVSSERIKIFETQGLFGVSKEVELKWHAAIEVPKEQYIHLLNFLEQEKGEEVARIGNAFYPKDSGDFLRTVLKSPATVDQDTARLLDTEVLAELVSQETVRLRDGTTKRISDLVLKNRVYRKHVYFCASCQSFIRQPYRATIHETESGKHALTYVSSYLFVVDETKRQASRNRKRKFPEILYRFWGIERGKVADKRRRSRKQPSIVSIPIAAASSTAFRARPVPTTNLLLAADISVDGHAVTAEEKIKALQRLEAEENGTSMVEQEQHPEQELLVEKSREIPPAGTTGPTIPLEVRHRLRKSKEIEVALQREAGVVIGLPELEMV